MNTKNLIRRFSFTGLPKRVYDLEENQIPEGEEGQLLSWDEAGSPTAVVLDAESVGALPDDYAPTATEVVTALQNMTPQQIEDIQTLLGITP